MAGQSEGIVDEVKPLKSSFDEMIDDAEAELQRLKQFINEATLQNKLDSYPTFGKKNFTIDHLLSSKGQSTV